jgi:hypothetical protein
LLAEMAGDTVGHLIGRISQGFSDGTGGRSGKCVGQRALGHRLAECTYRIRQNTCQ